MCAKSDKEHFRRPIVGERARIERARVSLMNFARVPVDELRIPVQLGEGGGSRREAQRYVEKRAALRHTPITLFRSGAR